jgi:hypothetical protein
MSVSFAIVMLFSVFIAIKWGGRRTDACRGEFSIFATMLGEDTLRSARGEQRKMSSAEWVEHWITFIHEYTTFAISIRSVSKHDKARSVKCVPFHLLDNWAFYLIQYQSEQSINSRRGRHESRNERVIKLSATEANIHQWIVLEHDLFWIPGRKLWRLCGIRCWGRNGNCH